MHDQETQKQSYEQVTLSQNTRLSHLSKKEVESICNSLESIPKSSFTFEHLRLYSFIEHLLCSDLSNTQIVQEESFIQINEYLLPLIRNLSCRSLDSYKTLFQYYWFQDRLLSKSLEKNARVRIFHDSDEEEFDLSPEDIIDCNGIFIYSSWSHNVKISIYLKKLLS